jgi:hypothetical protein
MREMETFFTSNHQLSLGKHVTPPANRFDVITHFKITPKEDY